MVNSDYCILKRISCKCKLSNIQNIYISVCMHAKSLQLCPALCDPMDHSPPGSSVHGILQARILEWVACPCLWEGLPRCPSGKEPTCQYRICLRQRFDLWIRKIPWTRAWQFTSVFLPGECHGQRSPEGYSP